MDDHAKSVLILWGPLHAYDGTYNYFIESIAPTILDIILMELTVGIFQ